MGTPQNSLVITKDDLRAHQDDAQSFIESVKLRVPMGAGRAMGTFVSSQHTTEESVSLRALISSINTGDALMSDIGLHTLRAIRTGLQVGLHLAAKYRERVGVDSFKTAAGLSDSQNKEYNEKMQTAAAVALFSFASYVLYDMVPHIAGNTFIGNIKATYDTPDISAPGQAFRSMVFYLGQLIKAESGHSDERLVAIVVGFAEAVQGQIVNRQESLGHTDAWKNVSYQLEESTFSVSGFEATPRETRVSVEFNKVNMDDIVGNADAKHFARRLAMRMLCYNFGEKKNVFAELGGLSPVWMGYGKPGTGKSMLIAALATLLDAYCRDLGIPFLFHPLPDNIVDSYQGNSAKNMVAWMKPIQSPDSIIFAPIDDAENILEERTRQGVSEGVRAVIGVFLRYTEGAYAINHGNATIGVFTNLPEQLDAAVRSRIQGRMIIDGAKTQEDFFDQDHLWFRKFKGQEGFNNLQAPTDYTYMSAQARLKSLADAAQTHDTPEHEAVKELFEQVLVLHDSKTHEFFAELYTMVLGRFPTFSSRDVRNIQSAVDQRIMDFDLPEDWFKTPEVFCNRPYDEQKAMVLELRGANMRGLSFADIYRQEAVRYLDNYAVIADAAFDRDVERAVTSLRVQNAAMARLITKN